MYNFNKRLINKFTQINKFKAYEKVTKIFMGYKNFFLLLLKMLINCYFLKFKDFLSLYELKGFK